MILSNSNVLKWTFFLALPVFFFTSCAEKRIKPTAIAETVLSRDTLQTFVMGPEKPNSMFLDKTTEYGLSDVEAVHLYVADVNNDGASDLIVLDDFSAAPKFYYFDKKEKKFLLGANPFNEIVRASYLLFLDLDHDHILDVIVGSLNQKTEITQFPARIYKGAISNKTVSYSLKTTLPTGLLPTASIVPLDYNLDGEIDLFLANWFSEKTGSPKPALDVLFEGKGFVFQDVSSQLKGEYDYSKSEKNFPNATPTFGASVCDVDKNGFPDILTNNSNGYFNKLWLNIDGKNFVNYGIESGYSSDGEGSQESRGGGNSFFSLCGDYNNDGFVDVVVGNLSKDSDPDSRDKSAVLTGSTNAFPPKFIRSEFYQLSGEVKWSEGMRRGTWIDYNLDGLSDILMENSGFPPSSRLVFFEQQADHAYEDKAQSYGINFLNPSGLVTLDLNGDGVMDFISGQSKVRAGEVKTKIYVYENQFKRTKEKSMRFHLQGKLSNSQGLSSTMVLTTNKSKYFGEANYSFGSLPSQNEEGVYFAFNHEEARELEVRWSFGNLDRLGRTGPMIKKYKLQNFKKNAHSEINLCEDGRAFLRPKNCY